MTSPEPVIRSAPYPLPRHPASRWARLLGTLLVLALGPDAAGEATEAVEYREGRVLYAKRCPGRWAFSYFDGKRLRNPCIGSSEQIPLERFLGQARTSLCRMQVRVNHAVIENGVLLASDIEEVWDCPSRFGGYPIFFPKW